MKKTILSVCLASSFLLSGCQEAQTENDINTSPNASAEVSSEIEVAEVTAEPISVVTSFYPLAFFTQQIAGDHAEVVNLAGDQSPHSYKISPRDRAKLEKADLVIYQGLGLESWTEDVIPELEGKNIATLEASHELSLLSTEDEHDEHEEDEHDEHEEEGHEDEHEEDNHEGEEGDEEMHADEGDHDKENHDEHDHGEFDPHTWLDPVLAQEIALHISEELIAIDPQNTKSYEANLEKLLQNLEDLDAEYTETLTASPVTKCKNTQALISHDAFGYLEERYNFSLHPIAGLSPNDEPSAKLLAELKEEVEHEGVTHVLTEENNIQAYAQTIADETGLQMASINPMGVTPKQGDYFSVSKNNLSALSSAFGCQ